MTRVLSILGALALLCGCGIQTTPPIARQTPTPLQTVKLGDAYCVASDESSFTIEQTGQLLKVGFIAYNCGTSAWIGAHLQLKSGSLLFPTSVELPQVAPGEGQKLYLFIKMPPKPGTYAATYGIAVTNGALGKGEFTVTISMVPNTPNPPSQVL